jgi:hypothetical protein
MVKVSIDEDREERITYEVLVDCYDEYEMRLGWYYYLEGKLEFPFEALWQSGKTSQQTVEVLGMAHEDDCTTDMLVVIKYQEGKLSDELVVPLTEISLQGENSLREDAIADWLYWLDHGGQLVDPDEYEEY